jgi:hypothetical protein
VKKKKFFYHPWYMEDREDNLSSLYFPEEILMFHSRRLVAKVLGTKAKNSIAYRSSKVLKQISLWYLLGVVSGCYYCERFLQTFRQHLFLSL